MLIIREAQMEALATAAVRRFETRVCSWLTATFPERCAELGADALRDLVQQGIKKAAGYGINQERDVAEFIALMVRLSPEFDALDTYAWTARLLRRAHVPAELRLERIKERLGGEERRQVHARGE